MEIPFTFALDAATQRAMLAASAPKEIPTWFRATLQGNEPAFITTTAFAREHELAEKVITDDDGLLCEAPVLKEHARACEPMRSAEALEVLAKLGRAYRKTQEASQRERYAWRQHRDRETLFQWPFAYADEVMKRK